VLLKLGEIVERIRFAEAAGMDQAHEKVADVSAVLGFVEN